MDRAVIDTVVFVRALLNYRSVWARLLFHPDPNYLVVLSAEIVDEVQAVVARPAARRKFRTVPGWDTEAVASTLQDAEIVIPAQMAPICRDPKDDKFLATALAGRAGYLISEDQDLLVLEQIGQTRILTARALLDR